VGVAMEDAGIHILWPFGIFLWQFGIFYGFLVYFDIFSRFGILCQEKSGSPAIKVVAFCLSRPFNWALNAKYLQPEVSSSFLFLRDVLSKQFGTQWLYISAIRSNLFSKNLFPQLSG
jgi:hypothetical protein